MGQQGRGRRSEREKGFNPVKYYCPYHSAGNYNILGCASRKDNDAEHSWHLAIMAVLLAEQANEKIDVLRTVTMVLIHDVVEIDAGDTYAYDSAGNESKREREKRAADRIFNILPSDQANYMKELWEEFEAGKTPEAKFACTLDNVQPLLLNDASAGLSWREHGIKKSQVMKRNEKTEEGSDTLWEYARELIQKNAEFGNLKDE